MSCDRVCVNCHTYNESQCIDIEGDHEVSESDVDRLLAWARYHRNLAELSLDYSLDEVKRVVGTKPIFDPLEG